MTHTRDRFDRFFRNITGRRQKKPHNPPAAASTSITPEDLSVTGSNHIQQEQSIDSCSATPPAAKPLWERAYDALAEENPNLVNKYEELLAEEEQMATSEPNRATSSQLPTPHDLDSRTDRSRLLDTVIQIGLQRMEDNKTTFNFAGRKIVLEDQIAKAANFVVWGKDFIGSAVKNSPEASLVWAGVSLVLPLLTNATTAAEANQDGFTYVTSRMRYYVALEPMLRRLGGNAGVDKELMSEATVHLVDLCRAILDFQLSSVLRFYRSRFKVYVHDTVTSKDWKQTLLDIEKREQTVNSDLDQINGLAVRQELEDLNRTSKDTRATMENSLSVAIQQLEVLNQIAAAQKDAEQKRLLDEQRKEQQNCLQLFYLTPNGKGATYDWYKSRVESRVEGTCNWFLQHENFQTWLSQESGPLLVSADPGCGKSVLAKYLIDHGLANQSATICYFFFKDQDQNTIRQALCALLHQLLTKKRPLIQHAMELYNDMGAALVQSEPSLWTILRDAVRDPRAGPVIFVIDALDECDESQLSSFITDLEKLFNAGFKVLMTSRPYQEVVNKFYSLQENSRRIHIPGEEEFETIGEEINCVIRHRVEQLAKTLRLSDEIQSSLARKLLSIEHRTYLWVYLVFDYLEKKGFKRTDDGIDATIQTLPETVNEAYDQILKRSQEVNAVKKALSIILGARRPLTLSEMNIAMNLNGQGRGQSVFVLDLEQDSDFNSRLRTLCGLFVNVHHGKIYFLHQTAREFLLQSSAPTAIPSGLQWHRSITIRHAHSVLAEICMFYLDMLNSTDTNIFRQGGQHVALSDYSVEHWGHHCREAEYEKGSAMVDLAVGLCTPDMKSRSQWASIFSERYHIGPASATNVLVSSRFGLSPVTELLLSMKADIEVKDSQGWTALMHAAWYGHKPVTRLLPGKGADVEVKDTRGMTALILAAEHGHEADTLLLLENGAKINAKNDDNWTALMHAARYGYEPVTRLLLGKGADIEVKDTRGMTALILAAGYGHEADALLLLENGANVNAKNDDSCTALMHAAWFGFEPVTRLLLGKGADLEVKDTRDMTARGMTALILAAEHGHEADALLLLENGANINAKNNIGWTALMHAAWFGFEPVTRLLLGKGADVEVKSTRGMTALLLAAEQGREADIRLLLENGANVDAKNNDGRTALAFAADFGHEAVARLLLENGADIETRANNGWTALIYAAKADQEESTPKPATGGFRERFKTAMFRRMTGRLQVKPAGPGHEAVTRLLLENGADVEAKDKVGKTALMHAAGSARATTVRILLDNGANIEAKDNDGATALMLSASAGHEDVAELLLENGADIEARDGRGWTALMLAASSGHEDVVRILLENSANIEAKDNDGWTALRHATGTAKQLLLDHGA